MTFPILRHHRHNAGLIWILFRTIITVGELRSPLLRLGIFRKL